MPPISNDWLEPLRSEFSKPYYRKLHAKVMEELGYTVVNKENAEKGWYTIDWTKTRAVNMRTSHIYVNLKGRDPEGIVEPEDYDALVQQIISDLYAYRDPVHGERVVSFAMTREEMECVGMGGKHCGDIFFQMRPDFQLINMVVQD